MAHSFEIYGPVMRSLIDSLIKAYRNEKCTGELLPYAENVMDFLQKNLPKQIDYANSIKKAHVIKSIYEEEIERVKYFMREYIIARMRKINRGFNIDKRLLSNHEERYYISIADLYREKDIFVECEWESQEFVGFISLVESENVVIDHNSVELRVGDFFVAPLKDVVSLLYRNEIYLV